MKVIEATKKGFCFGVEHAIEEAEKLVNERQHVYCLGQIIHNTEVVERLERKGLKVVNDLDEVPAPGPDTPADEIPTVLIRSHGCRPEQLQRVQKLGFHLVDATCVLVQRLQNLVAQLYEQGYQVVLVGDPNHPEIKGVMGYAPQVTVVNGPEDLSKLPPRGKLAMVSQTTYTLADFGEIVGQVAQLGYEEIKVVNTICRETARRQESAIELCRQVDVMFVLGSHHSANTGELAELCRRQGVATYHLQDWSEFKPDYVSGRQVAGVSAGASTPDWIIREFIEKLLAI